MIIEKIYKCEYCGKVFDDEYSCSCHEWNEHILKGFMGTIYDSKKNPMPLKAETDLSLVYYIVVTNPEDIEIINSFLIDQDFTRINYTSTFPDLYWWNNSTNDWCNLTTEKNKLKELYETFINK